MGYTFGGKQSQVVLLLNSATIAALMLLFVTASAAAQNPEPNNSILVEFEIDGKALACVPKIQVRLDGQTIMLESIVGGFVVPAAFRKKISEWKLSDNVEVTANCGEYTLSFPEVDPTWVRTGSWELGIAYPPYSVEGYRGTGYIEKGAWLSYFVFDCKGCDPGVYFAIPHPEPPPAVLARLIREQPNALGESAMDTAYELAVFGHEHRKNRNYLQGLLNACLAKSKESSEDDVCSSNLLDMLANLYWRGDSHLLVPLLKVAEPRGDVIHDIGLFYASLLGRRTKATLHALETLPVTKQETICQLAGYSQLSQQSPWFLDIGDNLRFFHGRVADRCLEQFEKGARHED